NARRPAGPHRPGGGGPGAPAGRPCRRLGRVRVGPLGHLLRFGAVAALTGRERPQLASRPAPSPRRALRWAVLWPCAARAELRSSPAAAAPSQKGTPPDGTPERAE